MKIRFINTTTKFPVDKKIEKKFHNTIKGAYKKAVESAQHQEYIDVFFVNEEELNENIKSNEINEINEENSTTPIDWLGIYIQKYQKYNRNIIKICPEKINRTCKLLKKPDFYPTLLVAVVIHELAHWLMCQSSEKISEEVIDEIPCGWLQQIKPANQIANWENDRHFIEESLANSFILKQKINDNELNFLKRFTDGQPDGYKQGTRWSGDLKTTIETAKDWKKFKSRVDHEEWNLVFYKNNNHTPTQELINSLKLNPPEKAIDSFNFTKAYTKHLAIHIKTRKDQRENDKGDFSLYKLKSIEDAQNIKEFPNTIDGNFNCSFNELKSLDGIPVKIGGFLDISNNRFTSLQGIKQLKEMKGLLYTYNCPIKSHILGVFFINGCSGILANNRSNFGKAVAIVNCHIRKGRSGLLPCTKELIEAGLEEFAKI